MNCVICGKRASWLVRFFTGAAHAYCNFHATRNKSVLVWKTSDVIEATRL